MKDLLLTDAQIQALIDEPKVMGMSVNSLLRKMVAKSGKQGSILQNSSEFSRNNGDGDWLIYLRCSVHNELDFSCGLKFFPTGREKKYTLLRYNGKSHHHVNRIEKGQEFYDFHIHKATERYQRSRHFRDEHYAEPTDRYKNFHEALVMMLLDCNVDEHSSNEADNIVLTYDK